MVKLDVFVSCISATRPDAMVLHPSCPTAFNATCRIDSNKARKEILQECGDPQINEKILQKHNLVRLFGSSDEPVKSGLQIRKILSVWASVQKL